MARGSSRQGICQGGDHTHPLCWMDGAGPSHCWTWGCPTKLGHGGGHSTRSLDGARASSGFLSRRLSEQTLLVEKLTVQSEQRERKIASLKLDVQRLVCGAAEEHLMVVSVCPAEGFSAYRNLGGTAGTNWLRTPCGLRLHPCRLKLIPCKAS